MHGTRVVFQFDDRSLDRLQRVTREAGFPDLAATITTALRLVSDLQQDVRAGATEVVVRNPVTGRQRVIELAGLVSPREGGTGEAASGR